MCGKEHVESCQILTDQNSFPHKCLVKNNSPLNLQEAPAALKENASPGLQQSFEGVD